MRIWLQICYARPLSSVPHWNYKRPFPVSDSIKASFSMPSQFGMQIYGGAVGVGCVTWNAGDEGYFVINLNFKEF